MKRNVFCLLLALALVVVAAFAVTPSAMATDDTEILVPTSEPEQTTHTHCACGGKFEGQHGHTCEEIVYEPVLSDASFETYSYKDSSLTVKTENVIRSGNYILDGDTTITKTIYIPYGDTVNLCLNGFKLSSSKVQTFKPNGKLTICDCSEESTGQVYTGNTAQSPLFYTYAGSEVNIYGGTFSSAAPGTGRTYAGCFTVATDAGRFDYDPDGDGVKATKPASVMNIYGGKLIGSDLRASNTDWTKTPTGAGRGGCGMVMHSDCTLNVYGGELVGGATVPYANGGKQGGGVIYNAGQLNIMGGTFSGSRDPLGAIHAISSGAPVTVSGAPVFTDNEGSDFYIGNNLPLYIGEGGVSTAFTYVAGSLTGGEAAQATQNPVHEDVCICGGNISAAAQQASGHVCTPVTTWQPLTSTNIGNYFKVSGSKYYLKDDVDELYLYLTAEYTLSYPIEIAAGKTLHIDLNGFWLTGSASSLNTSAFRVIGTFTVCDSSDAGSGRLIARRTGTGEGPIYLLNKPSGYASPVMEIYGGSITAYNQKSSSDTTRTTAGKGGVIHVGNNSDAAATPATLNIYGGAIYGAKTIRAGAMYVQGSNVNIYDGLISGGEANKGTSTATNAGCGGVMQVINNSTLHMYGGTITGGKASVNGGNILVSGNGKFYLHNGTISGGNAAGNGGSIYMLDTAQFTMENGTITGGTAAKIGGNVYLGADGCKFIMEDGAITGGTAATRGGNVYVLMGTFTMNGGAITGGSLTGTAADNYGLDLALGADSKGPKVTLNGAVTIGELGVNGQPGEGYAFAVGENFATEQPIPISSKNEGVAIKNIEEALLAYFVTADATEFLYYDAEGQDAIIREIGAEYHCKCGGNLSDSVTSGIQHACSDIKWTLIDQAWVDAQISGGTHVTDGLAKADSWVLPVGNYMLTENVTSTIPMVVADNDTKVVNLDLNGNTFTFDTGSAKYGMLVRGKFNISDSNYDPADPNAQWGKVLGQGTVGGSAMYVCSSSNATFLYGGEFACAAEKITTSGPVNVSGTFHICNGQITGVDTTASGGAMAINDNGNVSLWDGVVQGAKATQGGAIYMQKRSGYTTKLYIRGGKVTGGTATEYGGNIFVQGPFEMRAGIVENGVAQSNSGGNISVYQATATITGGTVTGGSAYEGGNISVRGGATLNIQGGTVSNGYARNHGGNIVAFNKLNVSGGEIVGGSARRGGNISTFANSGNITVTGGKIYNGILYNVDEDEDGVDDKLPGEMYGANISMNAAQEGKTIYLTVTGGEIGGFGEGCVEGVSSVHIGSAGENVVTTLGGTAVIDQIRLGTGRMITIDEDGFQDGASIGVERFAVSGIFAPEVAQDYSAYFHGTEANTTIQAAQTETGYNLILVSSVPYYAYNEKNVALGSANTIAEAMAIEGATFVRLVIDGFSTDEVYMGDLYLDLCGNELYSLTVNGNLYLIDMAGNDFQEDVLGGFYGEATNIVSFHTNSLERINNEYHYFVAADAEGLYRAHRVEVVLTHVSLKANADALGYRAEVHGDSVVLANITGYGFNLNLKNNYVKTYQTQGNPTDGTFTLRLNGIMAAGGGEMEIMGEPFVCFGEGVANGDTYTTSMKQTILAVNKLTTLTDTQKEAVYGLYEQYKAVMDTWFGTATNNIATWAPVVEEPEVPETSEPTTDGTDTTV